MYKLGLNGRQCVSCGICMDVCPVRAISMHVQRAQPTIEGPIRTHGLLSGAGRFPAEANGVMTYPYLACPVLCDGCGLCIRQCPVSALTLIAGEA